MLSKESDTCKESSVSLLNCDNADKDVSTSERGEKTNNDTLSLWSPVNTSNGIAVAGHAEEEKTREKWTVPEGYSFLPEELFQIKGIPPPLVSLSWLKLISSDEESGEDSVPLAQLKKIIKKKRKLEKDKSSRSLNGADDELKQKLKKRRKKQEVEGPINRKRGRPKKSSVEASAPENELDKSIDDSFWGSKSDSSGPDIQDVEEEEEKNIAEDFSVFSVNHNEHDYFKPFTDTAAEESKIREGENKKKKKQSAIQGVKSGDSKISFPCFECGKSFSAASTLKSHQRIHNGTLLICPECHKGFVSKYLLKCHMRIHNGDLFMCHKCGRGFTTAELLKVHSRTHTGDRPFVCNVCGKSFPTSSNMMQHKQIHNSEKKFLCSQCGSSFVQKRCLDHHMLTHSEKKNICNVCGKLWARKSDLIEHMRVHTGVKPYCCSICPQKFSQASSLKRHQLVHLDAKPISCVTCNRMFKCQEYYKRHLRKHENEDYLFNDI